MSTILITNANPNTFLLTLSTLLRSPLRSPPLQLIFNTYGDNIFYSDPSRSNIYLTGGATPTNSQSLLYLSRNEIITALQDLYAECRVEGKYVGELGAVLDKNLREYVRAIDKRDVREARDLMK